MEVPSLEIIYIIITLIFSAFFSGIEIAFISANKIHFELQKQKGGLTGWFLSIFSNNRPQFLATTLVGNNLALVLYAIFMAQLLKPVLINTIPEPFNTALLILLLQTVLSTILVLITAEFIPKSIFMLNPDILISLFAIPMGIIYILFFVPVWFVVLLSRGMIKGVFRVEYSEDKPVFGLTDLNNYIKNTFTDADDKQSQEVDSDLFSNAIDFKSVRVRECMIPRTEIVAVDQSDSIEELKELFTVSGHSKIIVYKETVDDIVGYCHSLELFKKPKDIKSIMNPIIIVPETMPANELMIQFITERKSLALVVDEYGGTSGIVSMEDIIEEIFGEIQDEHDDEYLIEEMLDDGNFLLSARHEVDYLNDKYAWGLPTGDYDTLGGLILDFNENIPAKNEVIDIPPFTFTIFSMEDNRIDKVKLTLGDLEGSKTE